MDTKIRAVVKRVMRKVGTLVTVQRVAIGAYSPGSSTITTSAADFEVYGRLDEYTDRELSNTIRAGDRKLFLAAADLSFVPVVSDKVVIAEDSFDIVRVTREMAKDEPAMYVLQLRA